MRNPSPFTRDEHFSSLMKHNTIDTVPLLHSRFADDSHYFLIFDFIYSSLNCSSPGWSWRLSSVLTQFKLIHIRSIFRKFTELSYNLQDLILWINKCTLTSFVALGTQSEGNASKNKRTNSWFPLHNNAPAHRSVLIKDFLARTMWQHGVSPTRSWPGSSWFSLVPSTEISTEGTALSWCYWHNWECDGRTEKVLTIWLPECFQHFYSRWEKCTVAQADNFERMLLKWFHCLEFLRNKVISGIFWSYHVHTILSTVMLLNFYSNWK